MGLLNKILGIEKGVEEVTRNLMNLMRDVISNANTKDTLEQYIKRSGIHYNIDDEDGINFIISLKKDNWQFRYLDDSVTVYNADSFGDFYPIQLMLTKNEQIIYYIVNRYDRQPGELGQIMLKKLKLFGAIDLHSGL